jgi:hypothetical protein
VQEDRFEALDRNGDLKIDVAEWDAMTPGPKSGERPRRRPEGR